MSNIEQVITGPRLRTIEAAAMIPALPGFVFAVAILLDGELTSATALVIPFWGGYGVVGVTVVGLSEVARHKHPNPDLVVSRIAVGLVCCYIIGLILLLSSYYLTGGNIDTEPFHTAFGLGIAIPTISTGALCSVVVIRFITMIARFIQQSIRM